MILRHVVPPLSLLTLLLIGCDPCADPNSYQGQAASGFASAAYSACTNKAGPLCGTPPSSQLTGPDNPDCDEAVDGPGAEPSALKLSPTDPSYSGSDSCVSCVLAACVSEARACFGELTCTCLDAKASGISWPASVPCVAPDSTYAGWTTCLADHCKTECNAP